MLALTSVVFFECAGANEVAEAAMRGDRAALRALLDRGTDPNAPRADGSTALHWAVYNEDLDSVRALLAARADVRAGNPQGMTPLALAAIAGHAEILRALLDAGADANARLGNGETPLMLAARTGKVPALQVLLDRGADVNAAERLRGTTALMWAAAYGNPAAVQALLAKGADVAARSNAVPRGRRPYLAPTAVSRLEEFHRGVGQGGESIPVVLDADPTVATERADAAEAPPPELGEDDDLEAAPAANPAEPGGGLTALVFAAREGDVEAARLLLAAGANVNQTTEYGWTPLLAATQNRHYRLGALLLEHGADPRIANKGGWTPLYIATDNRNIESGDYPVRRPDMDHLDYIRLLLDAGADVNARMRSSTETRTVFTHQWLYEEGATPFLRAAQSGDLALLRLLLEHGADPSLNADDGTTPLMAAAGIGWVEGVTYEWSEQESFETVRFLLELGADVNAHGPDGRTALMGAAHKGRNDVVQLLVDHGADLAARDIGSRDSIHKLYGVTWQALDYAEGLVRVGVQSAIAHPETAALIRRLMEERGLPVPPPGRTLDSICVTPELCE